MFYLAQLPNEILLHIFGFLGPSDLLPCGLVCRHWQSLSNHESLWRHLCNSLHGPCRRHSCRSTQLTRLVGANCVGDVCAKQHFWAISWARNSIPMGSINTIDSLEENIIHKLVKKRETSGFPTTNRCHWAVQCLLDHGLNADHRNMQGRSPAHLVFLSYLLFFSYYLKYTFLLTLSNLSISHAAGCLDRGYRTLTDVICQQIRGS